MPDSVDDQSIPSIVNMMTTPMLLDVLSWGESAKRNSFIYSANFPDHYFEQFVSTFAAILLRTHMYFRGDFVFTIRLNSTQFHQGLLRWLLIPMHTRSTTINNSVYEVSDASILSFDGEWMNASESNSIELRWNWLTNYEFIPLRASDYNSFKHRLFTLVGSVTSPLIAASTASSAVEISIFVHVENPRVAVRTVEHALPTFRREVEEQGLSDALGGMMSVATGALETYNAAVSGNIVGAITAGQKTLKGVSTVSDNLDRPLYTSELNLMQRSNVVLGHGDGPEGAVRYGLEPQETHQTAGELGLDEMDVRKIAQQFAIVDRISWPSETAAGAPLAKYPCGYNWVTKTQIGSTTVPVIFAFPPITMASVRYARVKGSLKFRFKVVGTAFHKGRIMVTYHPHKGAVESNITDNTAAKYVVFDYSSSNNEFDWMIPYYQDAGWIENFKGPNDFFVNGSAASQAQLNNGYGQINVSIANNLVVTNNISSSVEIIVMVAGGPDIDFGCPSYGFPTYRVAWPDKPPTRKNSEFEVIAQVNESTVVSPEPLLSASKDETRVGSYKELFHGDANETSLKVLLRRKCLLYRGLTKLDGNPRLTKWPCCPMLQAYAGVDLTSNPLSAANCVVPHSHLCWWAQGFVLWSGPQSWTVVTNVDKTSKVLAFSRHFPVFNSDEAVHIESDNVQVPNQAIMSNLAHDVVNASHFPSINMSTPFTSSYKALPLVNGAAYSSSGPLAPPSMDIGAGEVYISFHYHGTATTAADLEYMLFQSAGDGFRLDKFIGMPTLSIPLADWNASGTY